ncbi:SDR family oxidoreductase [Patescibacteria group bacterium]|nr:SDR family oxidoreductase [Patescibacteria group bacterium]MBU4367276.1 SDR family oxidoreductase [Patescibacteria group bacterium]MBU4462007.1 SDR family oxidoreductase [Patescibacteria group bacterium]MCG2700198.1 SDR family oxidoreductase [Candidatus Parcubacteria bacterium]
MFKPKKQTKQFCDLTGKVAIITGARRGMGRTHALVLAKAGAKVVVSDISQEECEKVVEEIKAAGGEAIAVKCDISQKAEVEELVRKTVEKFDRLDILVNNAGICPFKPFLELTEEDWDKVLDINLKGYFLCSQTAAKEIAKQKKGAIVNIASIAMGQVGVGFQGITHYCASKGGIVAMAEAMSLELAPLGIRVNTIAPGAIDTPMVASVKQDMKSLEATLAGIPLGRMGNPEEVSNAVLFLASDESSYMTGSVVVVDGGWLAG